jgi:hypothetical protein
MAYELAQEPIAGNMVQRGFWQSIIESFKRGESSFMADVGVGDALIHPEKADQLEGALRVQRKLREKRALDPVEGNWLADFLYSGSETAGQMFEQVKRAGPMSAVGAAAGAVAGKVAGFVIPGPVDDAVLIPTLAKGGAQLLGGSTAGIMSYRQGVGQIYSALRDQGIDHDKARQLAMGKWGVMYAALDFLQLTTLGKGVGKTVIGKGISGGISDIIAKLALKYPATVGKEALQEAAQELMQIGAEQEAKGKPPEHLLNYAVDESERLWDTFTQATKAFALLPLPGSVVEGVIAHGNTLALQEQENMRKRMESGESLHVSAKDMTDPAAAIQFAAQERMVQLAEQIKVTVSEKDRGPSLRRPVQPAPKAFDYSYTQFPNRDLAKLSETRLKQEALSVPKTHVANRHMGQGAGGIAALFNTNEFDGMYFSTEPAGNRYATVDSPAVSYQVDIKNPKVFTSLTDYQTFREQFYPKGYRLGERSTGDDAYIYAMDRFNRNEISSQQLESDMKDISAASYKASAALQEQGYDSVYLPQSDMTEGILVVFDPAKAKPLTPAELSTLQAQRAAGQIAATSSKTYKKQEQVRRQERAKKFAKVDAIRRNYPADTWVEKTYQSEALVGELTKLKINPTIDSVSPQTFMDMREEIRTAPDTGKLQLMEAFKLDEALQRYYQKDVTLRPHELKYLRSVFGDAAADAVEQAQELQEMALQDEPIKLSLVDYMMGVKTIMASADVSRVLRQNAMVMTTKEGWKAAGRDLASFSGTFGQSVDMLQQLEKEAWTTDEGQALLKAGTRRELTGNVPSVLKSERFAGNTGWIAKYLPGVRRSEIVYTAGGNILRAELGTRILKQWKAHGVYGFGGKLLGNARQVTDHDVESLATVLNHLTGVGSMRGLRAFFGKYATLLNAVFFAPGLVESRFLSIADLFNKNISWAARRVLAAQWAKFVSINFSVLGALSMMPPDVREKIKLKDMEFDPRSTDFGKIRVGDLRIDFWGGYLPMARLAARIITQKRKDPLGELVDIDTGDEFMRFLQSKLGPVPGVVYDIVKGENMIGEPVNLDSEGATKLFYQNFTPLFIQDMAEALRLQGLWGIPSALSFIGAGIATYEDSPSVKLRKYKDEISRETFGKRWDQLSDKYQEYLRKVDPQMMWKEQEAAYDLNQRRRSAAAVQQQQLVGKQMFKKLPADVRQEMDRLQITASFGVSPRINKWKLNKERYTEYKDKVQAAYNAILGPMIRSEQWRWMPDKVKLLWLDKTLRRIKNQGREQVLRSARLEDLIKVEE